MKEAHWAAEHLSHHPIHRVVCSPLKRTCQTAEIAAELCQCPVEVHAAFREVDVGELETQPPTRAAWEHFDHTLHRWLVHHEDCPFPGGEDRAGFVDRLQTGMVHVQHLARQGPVVVSHGAVLAALVSVTCGLPAAPLLQAPLYTGELAVLHPDPASDVSSLVLQAWKVKPGPCSSMV